MRNSRYTAELMNVTKQHESNIGNPAPRQCEDSKCNFSFALFYDFTFPCSINMFSASQNPFKVQIFAESNNTRVLSTFWLAFSSHTQGVIIFCDLSAPSNPFHKQNLLCYSFRTSNRSYLAKDRQTLQHID